MIELRSGPRPIVPINAFENLLGSGVHWNGDGTVTAGTWTGPAAYDLVIPAGGPMSGTYRLWCQGPAYYCYNRCGDDRNCGEGAGTLGLSICMAPTCITPGPAVFGGTPPCGNWGHICDPPSWIPPAYAMQLQVYWQAQPDGTFDHDAAAANMAACGPSGIGLAALAEGPDYPQPFYEGYESGHWVGLLISQDGSEPDTCGTCGTLVGQYWTDATGTNGNYNTDGTAAGSAALCLAAVGAGMTLTFYNYWYSCPDVPLTGVIGATVPNPANQFVYGGNWPTTAGPVATPVSDATLAEFWGCGDKYDCYSQVLKNPPGPCCLEIEFAGVRPGAEVSVYGAEYGYPNAGGLADPSNYLNRRLKYRRTQCVNATYYGSTVPEPSDQWACKPYGALNPCPTLFSLAVLPKTIVLQRGPYYQDAGSVAACLDQSDPVQITDTMRITGYIVTASVSGAEMSLREPTHPAPSILGGPASAPLAEANGVTFQGTLPGNGAQATIEGLLGTGSTDWTRIDGPDGNDCSDLTGLYVDSSMPIGTGCQCFMQIGSASGTGGDFCTVGNTYTCGAAGPPITIHDLDGTGTGGTTAWHMTPLPGPGACSDYRGTDYWSGPATATVHVPSISGDSLGTADADFWPCNNVEKNDPTKNVLGWQLAFTDLDGRAQELVFWPDSRDNGNSWSAALSPGWFPGHDTAGWPLPWRITRETTLQNREGATLLRIRTGHQKYTFDRGFVVPTSWYQDSAGGGGVAGNNPLDLCAGSPPPCQGAPLTNTIFGSLPVDPDDHCTAIDDNGACIAYDDPQTLAYRYLMLDEGFLPGSTITLTPVCRPPSGDCPEPAPAQCNQIDGVNLFNLPWGDVLLASLAGNRQPPFGLSNGPGGFDYLLARTADGPLGQANFTLTLTPHGGSSPSYSCTFTTGLVADCFYSGPIPLGLPGTSQPWLEWYYARDCDAVQWQVTFDGTTADGHNWGTGADAPGGTDVVQTLPPIGGNGLPPGPVPDSHNPGLPLFNTPTAPSWWHGTSAPEIDGHARRIDIVRTASGAYLLTVSDYYPGSGSAADPSRWNHLWAVLGAGCCSNSYTGVAMLTFNPANPTPYPFASCGAASGVTVTAVPQLCHEQCAATTWTVTRGPLTWTLSGSAGGPWSDTVSAGVQAEAVQQGTTTKYTIAWRWTDGTHYLTWSATADSSVSGPQTVTLAGSDTLTWPVTISYAAGTWTLTFPWPGGPYSFSFSGAGWQTLGSLALTLTQNTDAGGHGWYTLSIVVAGGLTIGRTFADPWDSVRDCQVAFAAGAPIELSDSAGNDYGLVTITALT